MINHKLKLCMAITSMLSISTPSIAANFIMKDAPGKLTNAPLYTDFVKGDEFREYFFAKTYEFSQQDKSKTPFQVLYSAKNRGYSVRAEPYLKYEDVLVNAMTFNRPKDDSGLTPLEAYKWNMTEYAGSNAFAKRRVVKKAGSIIEESFSSSDPSSIKGHIVALTPNTIQKGQPFDFDHMTKTIKDRQACKPNSPISKRFSVASGGMQYTDSVIYPSSYDVNTQYEKGCNVTISFGNDDVLAEKFEVAHNSGRLNSIIYAKFTGYDVEGVPILIPQTLVYAVEHADKNNTYEYLLDVKTLTPAPSFGDVAQNMLSQNVISKPDEYETWKKHFNPKGINGYDPGNKASYFMTLDQQSNVLTVAVNDFADTGAYGQYRILQTPKGYIAALERFQFNHTRLPEMFSIVGYGLSSITSKMNAVEIDLRRTQMYQLNVWDKILPRLQFDESAILETDLISELNLPNVIANKPVQQAPIAKTTNVPQEPATAKPVAKKETAQQQPTVKVETVPLGEVKLSEYAQKCTEYTFVDDGGFFSGADMLSTISVDAPIDYVIARMKKHFEGEGQVIVASAKDNGFNSRQYASGSTERFYNTEVWLDNGNLYYHLKTPAAAIVKEKDFKESFCNAVQYI